MTSQREVSANLRPVLRQYLCAPAPAFPSLRMTRGRSAVARDLQRGCNGVGGEALQAKPLRLLDNSHSATLQRCNSGLARVCGCDATRCGHIYARGTRCAVAALQSSFKRGISIAWAATPFATLAATAVAAILRPGFEARSGARSIKYPRISAGSGRAVAIGPNWGLWCACAGRSAALAGVQAADLVAAPGRASLTGRIEQNQGLGGCEAVPFASFVFAFAGKGERCQQVEADQRLTVRAKSRSPMAWGEASRGNPPPGLAGTPTPGRPHPALSASPLAAPVGPDPKASPQGRASLGNCREPEGPGRAGSRGTGSWAAGPREYIHG